MVSFSDSTQEQRELAVSVVNAYKRYTPKTMVLKSLNMSVPHGTIYGLLGPSGCGKTTLLRCIMGRSSLDQGQIYVKARRRRNMGYMPQDIALQEDLSIKETFEYYARLFNMNWSYMKESQRDLMKLLELPKGSRIVGTLSGGQQRRLSFAVTLLHDPQLLILDEPTVGVDPILRQSLWDHLLQLAIDGKTIIITTHYIEEARQAHKIGLMRGGSILAEESPEGLLISQGCTTLEEAFLKLCTKQTFVESTDSFSEAVDYKVEKPQNHLEEERIWNMGRFMAQLKRHLIWAKRNTSVMAFLLLLPALLAFICIYMFRSHPHHLKVGVVSDELKHGFSECRGDPINSCYNFTEPIICAFKDFLPKDKLVLKEYPSLDSAKEGVKVGEVWGVLHFHDNYTKSVIERIEFGRSTSDNAVDLSTTDIWMDMSDAWLSHAVSVLIAYSFVDFTKAILTSCDYPPRIAELPIKFEEAIYGSNEPVFLHTAIPGLMCSFCFYLTLIFTTAAIMMEKNSGLLDRCLSAGMSFFEVVTAHVVLQSIVVVTQTAVLLVIVYVLFENPMIGSFLVILLLLFLIEGLGESYGFFLAFVFDDERIATYTAIGTLVGLFTLIGIAWPFEGMHFVLKNTIWAVPILPAIQSYTGISRKGWDLTHPVVYYGVLQTSFWIITLTVLSYIIFKLRKIGNN